ncbi:phosphate/phosphite/phosphonate ABC transporter substrate-binding protein [Nocardioides houyundeii]|uniref:phosphate/phosphite/phosphonate ABC transporter substrate-binding protein n=1 Tax=Nocardioides houyundeii TaxID=2045452 RepID=UPI000DF2389B|nr:phosphate/phosphite/phosphonate ABC transporter substrate-binding protein [Nocardioides houyundeii]
MFQSRKLALVAGLAALTLGLTACGGGDDAEAAADICPGGKVRFGIEPYEDPATLIPIYEELGKALEEKLDCPVELSVADSYVAEILAMKNEQLEIGQFGPLGYVFAHEQAGAIPVVSFAAEDGSLSSYTGGLWVPKGSEITDIEGLAGHTLALSEPGSTSGDAVPRKALIDAGVDGEVTVDYAGGHTEALLALTHGKVEAAEINSQTLAAAEAEGMFDPADFVQIWESEPIANDPITVAPHTSEEFRAAVQEALLNLDPETVAPIGEYLDFTPGENPMVEVDEKTYQPVVDLAETLGLTEDDL